MNNINIPYVYVGMNTFIKYNDSLVSYISKVNRAFGISCFVEFYAVTFLFCLYDS